MKNCSICEILVLELEAPFLGIPSIDIGSRQTNGTIKLIFQCQSEDLESIKLIEDNWYRDLNLILVVILAMH